LIIHTVLWGKSCTRMASTL